jgi:hypothetical protein
VRIPAGKKGGTGGPEPATGIFKKKSKKESFQILKMVAIFPVKLKDPIIFF